ncbi:cucumopine synthase-related protein [Pantoea agglomerans]
MTVDDAIALFDQQREKIWFEQPAEIAALGRGEVPRGTGARGQYLSTIIFAEGEARTLADEMLWGVIRVAEDHPDSADLKTLQMIITEIIGYKADFFDFVSLPDAAKLLHTYVHVAAECQSLDELVRLSHAALSWANRLHMWVDFILPWGLGDGFRRVKA